MTIEKAFKRTQQASKEFKRPLISSHFMSKYFDVFSQVLALYSLPCGARIPRLRPLQTTPPLEEVDPGPIGSIQHTWHPIPKTYAQLHNTCIKLNDRFSTNDLK